MESIGKDSFDVSLLPGMRQRLADVYRKFRAAHTNLDAEELGTNGDLKPGSFHTRDCPLCQGKQAAMLFRSRGMDIVRCSACSLIYSKQVVDESSDRKRYNSVFMAYYRELKNNEDYSFLESQKAIYIAEAIGQHLKDRASVSVLDIGSNNGCLLHACTDRGWSGYGIEANAELAAETRASGLSTAQGFFPTDLPDDWPSFNVIAMLDVLEHIEQPMPFLDQVRDHLKNEGFLAIQVPNFNSLIVRLEGADNSNFCHGHWTHFTPHSLDAMLIAAGFEPLTAETLITELDRIRQHSPEDIRKAYFELTGRELGNPADLDADRVHGDMIGYKLFAIYRKREGV